MQKNKPMSREEFEKFINSHTYKEIAEYFGCSIGVVTSTMKEYGIKKGRKYKLIEE